MKHLELQGLYVLYGSPHWGPINMSWIKRGSAIISGASMLGNEPLHGLSIGSLNLLWQFFWR